MKVTFIVRFASVYHWLTLYSRYAQLSLGYSGRCLSSVFVICDAHQRRQWLACPLHDPYTTLVRSFLRLVNLNCKVNHGILACDWLIAWLTSRLTLTRCRNDWTLVVFLCDDPFHHSLMYDSCVRWPNFIANTWKRCLVLSHPASNERFVDFPCWTWTNCHKYFHRTVSFCLRRSFTICCTSHGLFCTCRNRIKSIEISRPNLLKLTFHFLRW